MEFVVFIESLLIEIAMFLGVTNLLSIERVELAECKIRSYWRFFLTL